MTHSVPARAARRARRSVRAVLLAAALGVQALACGGDAARPAVVDAYGAHVESTAYVAVAVVLGLVAFVGTATFARYIERRGN